LRTSSATATASQGSEQLGTGVVLRWKTPSTSTPATNANTHTAATAFNSPPSAPTHTVFSGSYDRPASQGHSASYRQPENYRQSENYRQPGSNDAVASYDAPANYGGNPLRSSVATAAYQQSPNDPFSNPFGNDTQPPPALPPQESMPALPDLDPATDPLASPELPPPPDIQPLNQPPADQLAPVQPRRNEPGSILEEPPPRNPFPSQAQQASPRDRADTLDGVPGNQSERLQRRSTTSNSLSCNALRAALNNPLKELSLDVSPTYGEGLGSVGNDPNQERPRFSAAAESRDWTDYRGYVIATGRLIDMRDDRAIIETEDGERTIPVINLSDVDVAYLGETWNIPERCGTGYEQFAGREYIASTVQWKASGLSHKPLYFEDVQLERYGHETGPILQPLISTAHFFGGIVALPYNMGIHPPYECQYTLGYIRPGNCAPYMHQPIPISLRGAIAEAAVVVGAGALIP
jgi:hypothetical protein